MNAQRHALLIGIRDYVYPGANLRGPKNDVFLIGTLLRDRFGFPGKNLHVLLNEEATQAGILRAFDDMAERIDPGDVVVCFYSGHGSRMRDPLRPEQMLESIVPHDSGRGKMPNRDIPDFRIDGIIRRWNEKTPYVTLIFDCCHSGSVTRDPFASATRGIEADLRPPEEMFEGGRVPPLFEAAATRSIDAARESRDVGGQRRAVVIAACRAEEEAQEYVHREGGKTRIHGALSHFLGRTLQAASPGASWRDVFETAGPAVTARFTRQHPQIEGSWDDVLFGTREVHAAPYLRVSRVEGGVVELTGGLAHGVSWGSVWSLHPPGTRNAESAEEVARVRVESLDVASAEARPLEVGAAGRLAAGQRAFLRVEHLPAPGLNVRLEVDGDQAPELRRRIGESVLVAEAEPADVLVRCLAPRAVVGARDACPRLGPLPEETWAAVGRDGRLSVRLRRTGEAAALVGDLESRARYVRLLEIRNADPGSRLAGRLRLVVTRRTAEGTFAVAEPERGDGLPAFEEGEMADFEVHNDHDAPVRITLLQFGCDGGIVRLVPLPQHPAYKPGGHLLAAGEVLKLGEYYREDLRFRHWEGVRVQLPAEGFPWAAEPGEDGGSGLVHLKLMATLEPADFELLEQHPVLGPPDTRDPGVQRHPLLELARLYACGRGDRGLPLGPAAGAAAVDWTTVNRPVVLHRRGGGGPGRRAWQEES